MNIKRILCLALTVLLIAGAMTACTSTPAPVPESAPTPAPAPEPTPASESAPEAPSDPNEVPRNETLYIGGLQWGTINGWSPLMGSANNWCNDQGGGGSRTQMFETPYMFNGLNGEFVPLLADGPFSWNADMSAITFKFKSVAKWNDGTPVTAHDMQAYWETGLNYTPAANGSWAPYIESVTALDDLTVEVKAVMVDGKPANPLMVEQFLGQNYVLQKAWLEKVVQRNGGDPAKIDVDPGKDIAYTGPYGPYFDDDTKSILIRNDNYWGQDASMWGKLPTPKYLAHTIYIDNAATQVAFAAGEIDVNQQFIENVQNLWEVEGLPISTYMDEAPYGLCANTPTVWYNMNNAIIRDNVAIRKAIAWATDYDMINKNAMTGQSPTFAQVPRSMMNPTDGEQNAYNRDDPEVKALQWVGNDIEGAKALLDGAGITDSDGDGWRELNGQKLAFNIACPNGWTDWMASIEIVAAAGKNIGIDISTAFPESDPFLATITGSPNQTEYDIFMMWTDSIAPSAPWSRVRQFLDGDLATLENNWTGNWGHYVNAEATALVKAIPVESDPAALKELYTQAVKIYLTEVPSFAVMYRPDKFHAVNESVWTGFTESDDGRNVPPFNCLSGYAIADLFNLSLV